MTIVQTIAVLVLIAGVSGLLLFLFTWMVNRRVDQMFPVQGRLVDAGGVRFHVHEQGTGPSVLLIHGLAGQMRHFTYGVAQILSQSCHVVTIDRPGAGHSVRPATMSADISAQAASIAALMDVLKLGKTVIAGHSLGGAVALTLAVEHPGKVAGLALIAPLTHVPDNAAAPPAFRALTISSAWLRALFAWTLAVPGSILLRDAVLTQVFGPEPVPDDFAVKGGGLMSLCPRLFSAASRDLQAITDCLPRIESRYPELAIPVRVLYGRSDRILNWKENGQFLVDRLPGSTLQLVDGGHMLPVTQPELTAHFISTAVLQMMST